MPISKRAKMRLKVMNAADKRTVKKAAMTLYNCELLGPKRLKEIVRAAESTRKL